jgi:AcrR family transcriptional regulator
VRNFSKRPEKQSRTRTVKRKPVRERILQTANDSFYREGIRAVGVDTLIARSGVAKMSFYRSFRSKDELICAYLEHCASEYWNWWADVIGPRAHEPKKQLKALFVATARRVLGPGYRGCPFDNTLVEFPDSGHPAHEVIVRFKAERRARLRHLAQAAAAVDPERLADELGILLEGSPSCAESKRGDGPAAALVRAAEIIIGAETRRVSGHSAAAMSER